MNPPCMIWCDSSTGNDAVDMGMKQQVLSPRVENPKEANLGSKMLRIACDLQQRFSDGAKQQVVQLDLVLQHDGMQVMRQCEDDVEIACV